MKKQTKLMTIVTAAALISVVTPAFQTPTFAKSVGWVEEDSDWMFYEADGELATDSWKKSGDDWYYLNDDGLRTTNKAVEEYYVGDDGKRVFDKWVNEGNEDYGVTFDEPEFFYHYYDQYGKMVVSKWKNIESKWYYFDDEGRMLTGKTDIDGKTYYLGENTDGVRKSGWFELEDTSDDAEEEKAWNFFDRDGSMIIDAVDKKIGDAYYTFVGGKLQTGWYQLPKTASASEATTVTLADFQYYDEDGKRAEGWYTIEGAEAIANDDDVYTFYFKKGAPYYAEKDIEVYEISSQRYGFNTKGEMQNELMEKVTLNNDTVATYFFNDEGVAQTGKQVIFSDELGLDQTWYFNTDGSKKGQGYTGIRDNAIYEFGLRKDADKDLKFAPVTFNEKSYLVNAAGTIQKASSSSKSDLKADLGKGFKDYKDDNGQVWVVDKEGIVQQ